MESLKLQLELKRVALREEWALGLELVKWFLGFEGKERSWWWLKAWKKLKEVEGEDDQSNS